MRVEHEEELAEELSEGNALGFIARSRQPTNNGVVYGGVAVVWRHSMGLFKQVPVKNEEHYEVLIAAGSLKGHSRKLVVVACYIPPGYSKQRGQGALDHVEDVVIEMKRKYQDPFIVVTGDFNQWKINGSLSGFNDIKETKIGNTRGNRAIDRFFTNMSRSEVRGRSGYLGPPRNRRRGTKC